MVIENEPLTRFIFSRSHFSAEQKRAKHQAFLPPADLKLSVFRIENLSAEEIWKIGGRVESGRTEHLHARADLPGGAALQAGLRAISDEPPRRHANIVGWSAEDKDSRKIAAMELASLAALAIR